MCEKLFEDKHISPHPPTAYPSDGRAYIMSTTYSTVCLNTLFMSAKPRIVQSNDTDIVVIFLHSGIRAFWLKLQNIWYNKYIHSDPLFFFVHLFLMPALVTGIQETSSSSRRDLRSPPAHLPPLSHPFGDPKFLPVLVDLLQSQEPSSSSRRPSPVPRDLLQSGPPPVPGDHLQSQETSFSPGDLLQLQEASPSSRRPFPVPGDLLQFQEASSSSRGPPPVPRDHLQSLRPPPVPGDLLQFQETFSSSRRPSPVPGGFLKFRETSSSSRRPLPVPGGLLQF